MASGNLELRFKFTMHAESPTVMRRVNKWRFSTLRRVGDYARGEMKKQIRPKMAGVSRKAQLAVVFPTVDDMGMNWYGPAPPFVICLVPAVRGKIVLNQKTGKPVSRGVARLARLEIKKKSRRARTGEGKPPRQGPTNKLRTHIYRYVYGDEGTVVIGAMKFAKQPPMIGRVSVPELLNKGGVELLPMVQGAVGASLIPVKYGARPFVETILMPAVKRMFASMKRYPLH